MDLQYIHGYMVIRVYNKTIKLHTSFGPPGVETALRGAYCTFPVKHFVHIQQMITSLVRGLMRLFLTVVG